MTTASPPAATFLKPVRLAGNFVAFSLDVFWAIVKRPFPRQELIEQCRFSMSATLLPAITVAIPYVGLVGYQLTLILAAIGAGSLSGAAAGFATIPQIGPVGTLYVLGGALATAICADLGARTVREEVDAMEVLGVDVLHRLVMPRVMAAVLTSFFLMIVVIYSGLSCAFFFSVLAGFSPGEFIDTLGTFVALSDYVVAFVKVGVFAGLAALVACYRALTVKGGPKGLGQAVNETVVYAYILVFPLNSIMTQVPDSLGITS